MRPSAEDATSTAAPRWSKLPWKAADACCFSCDCGSASVFVVQGGNGTSSCHRSGACSGLRLRTSSHFVQSCTALPIHSLNASNFLFQSFLLYQTGLDLHQCNLEFCGCLGRGSGKIGLFLCFALIRACPCAHANNSSGGRSSSACRSIVH